MGKTLNKKMFIRLSTFILITTLLIPLTTHLFDEKISEKNQQQETNIDLDITIGNPSARYDVYPNTAIRDRDTIHASGRLSHSGSGIPNEEIRGLWNGSWIASDTTDSNGNFDIEFLPSVTIYEKFGNINVTAWFPGNGPYTEVWANETITVYAAIQLSLSLNPTILKHNDTFTATTRAEFDNGTDIANAQVYLRLWPGNDTEYGDTTNGFGEAYFYITINTTESAGLKSVTGALDISSLPFDTTYIKGSMGGGIYNDFWSNETRSIRVVEVHTITYILTAPSPAYRDFDNIQLDGTFEDEGGNPKTGEWVFATLYISGAYRRILNANDTVDGVGSFSIVFILPYQFDGNTVPVGSIIITVFPSTTWDNVTYQCLCDLNSLNVVSNTSITGLSVDRSSKLYHRDDSIIVNGNILDDHSDPVGSELLSIYLINNSIGYNSFQNSGTTTATGSFTITISPIDVPLGEASCYISANYSGSLYYNPSTFLDTLFFFESPDFTNIFLNSISISSYTSLQKSTNYDVEAQLIDDFGRDIVGRSVIVQWNGLPLSTQDTDSEGKVYTSFTTSDYSANPLSLQFSFDYYSGSAYMETYVFSLDNLAPTIDSFSVDPGEVELGDSCTISINVSDDGPVSNVTLVLTDPDGNETRITQQGGSLNFNLQFIIDTSQSRYNILGNWTFYIIVTDREGDSSFSTQGQFEVTEKKGTDIGDITLVVAIIAANVLAAISGYFIARKIRAEGGLGPFFQSLKGKIKK